MRTRVCFWGCLLVLLAGSIANAFVVIPGNPTPGEYGGGGPIEGSDPLFAFILHSGNSEAWIHVEGELNTLPNGDGSFTVIGGSAEVSGTLSGLIRGSMTLVPNSTAVIPFRSPLGAFDVDNQLFPGATPVLDNWGLLFRMDEPNSADNRFYEVNIWGNTGNAPYSFYQGYGAGIYNVQNNDSSFVLTAVIPEASSLVGWCVVGCTTAGIGWIRRRRPVCG